MSISAAGLNGVILVGVDNATPVCLTIEQAEQLVNELIDAMEDAREYRATNKPA